MKKKRKKESVPPVPESEEPHGAGGFIGSLLGAIQNGLDERQRQALWDECLECEHVRRDHSHGGGACLVGRSERRGGCRCRKFGNKL